MVESTAKNGCMHKTKFYKDGNNKEKMACKFEVAREHTKWMLYTKCKNYIQWFSEYENDVTDLLLRDDHLSPKQPTLIFNSLLNKHIAKYFKVITLTKEIKFFLC